MSDCFVLYLLLTCMKKKTSGADKFTNNNMGHYGLLLYHFNDIEVIATRQQMKERYEIFKEFKEKTHFEKNTNITS